jgi:hypothetical protein
MLEPAARSRSSILFLSFLVILDGKLEEDARVFGKLTMKEFSFIVFIFLVNSG